MTSLAPQMRDQRKIDAEHLKLLSIFHFVVAGLSIVGIGFLFFHWLLMHAFFANPEMWKGQNVQVPPREFFLIFRWFYLFFGVVLVTSGIVNLISGLLMRQGKARVFSLVVAGLDCLQFPFGTMLGVFTFVVLLRESVAELYAAKTEPPALP